MEWTEAPSEVGQIIARLIERTEEHEHLRAEHIMVLARAEEAGRKQSGKKSAVKASLVTSKERAMIARAISDWNIGEGSHQQYKYLLIVNLAAWGGLDARQKRYVIDHQLCRCWVTQSGKAAIVDEPLRIFPSVLKRHGAVFAGDQVTVADLRQLPLFAVEEELYEADLTMAILPPEEEGVAR